MDNFDGYSPAPDTFVADVPQSAGVRLVIPALPSLALSYCGAWATVRVQVVDTASGA